MSRNAETAQEHKFNLGVPDYSLACELADFEAAQEADETAARWEREGRREMYDTLEIYGFND